jgi:hypothetical protein
MRLGFRRALVVALICVFASLALSRPARAQFSGTIGPSKGAVVGIIAAAIAIPIVIGTVLYFVLRQPRLTGCVVQSADGLELMNEGDSQVYLLSGDTTGIKAGELIKITGKKQKKNGSGPRPLLVTALKKDYGVCKAPLTPVPAP